VSEYLQKIKNLIDEKLYLLNDYQFKLRMAGIPVTPFYADLVNYDILIEFIERNNILAVNGDFVEIGALFGGGTLKLSKYLEKKGIKKEIIVIDIFDLSFDETKNTDGHKMSDIYKAFLQNFGERTQLEVFQIITKDCQNIKILAEDSKKVKVENNVCFGIIDGNHSPEYVINDFYLIWNRLSNGGCISFDDYDGDIPEMTFTIDQLIKKHQDEIREIELTDDRKILFLIKK